MSDGKEVIIVCKEEMHRSKAWACKWLNRLKKQGLDGLKDKPICGRPLAVLHAKDTLGDIVITGEIKNNGTNTANFVELIATFYDTSNQTLGNKNTFTEPTTLQPKQAAPFTM